MSEVPRPKVLVLATTFPRWVNDSEPPFVWELTRRIQDAGYDCQVLVPHAKGAQREEEWGGVKIRRFRYATDSWEKVCYDGGAFPNLRASWKARLSLPGLLYQQRKWIHRIVNDEDIRLVHSHWIIPQGFWASSVCEKKKVPLLLTAHAGDVFGIKPPLAGPARTALGKSNAVTVNSRATREAVKALFPGSNPEIIPMGVELEKFKNIVDPHPLEGKPSLLAVGRFAEKKGFHRLIGAMPTLLERLPEADLHLVGFGPWESRLRKLVASLDLIKKVHFHGSISHSRIHSFFGGADLFVQPSLPDAGGDQEGLGVTVLEAMASGLPVVASASGGILDLIEPGVHGLLCEPGDSRDLANKILALWESEGKERMASAGRKRVEEEFSWDRVTDRFVKLYSNLIHA
ncbi:MAG: glycosyltransferase family 4 protein [Candidatus Omnitrophica bacterium]|nr:glycosyltransferase family 4 protein [Candidatus Omnitrophota bacterium]